jgi:hypothetical protein
MKCTICLRTGHTASSCSRRARDGSNAERFAAGMAALRDAPDSKPPDDWEKAWERLCRDMRKGWVP